MKKIVFTIVLAVLSLATTAQDTLYSTPPLMGMGQTSYFIPGNWWQEYEEEGDLTGCNVGDRIAEVAYRMYTDGRIVEIAVMDMHGRQVTTATDTGTINAETLATGPYIVRITVETADGSRKTTYRKLIVTD